MLSARRTLPVILIMAVLLLLGFGLVLGMKMMMMEMNPKLLSTETGTVVIALLALLLAYAILSGAIEELGFGGASNEMLLEHTTKNSCSKSMLGVCAHKRQQLPE
jgi:hypothetical protein